MKYILVILFVVISGAVFAQMKKDDIYGPWVKSKITYNNGTELPDDNALKYLYVRYTFKNPDGLNISTVYYEKGGDNKFEVNANILSVKLPLGATINQFRVEKTRDTLILVQDGDQGFDDPLALKYYFIPEAVYKNAVKLKADNIRSVIAGDTIYNQGPKVFAVYKDGSFHNAMTSGITGSIDMSGRSARFFATFIVFTNGIADSLKILEGIDDKYNKRFIKVFNQTRKNWEPAVLNGKIVPVEMKIEIRYLTSAEVLPSQDFTTNGNEAYAKQEYDVALEFYSQALDSYPTNKDNLYKRGICKLHLGNIQGACEDWNKIKALGGTDEADAMLAKYCK